MLASLQRCSVRELAEAKSPIAKAALAAVAIAVLAEKWILKNRLTLASIHAARPFGQQVMRRKLNHLF